MAKDRRDKAKNSQVDLSKRVASNQTGQKTTANRRSASARRKKNSQTARIVLWSLLIVLILAIAFLLVQIGMVIWEFFTGGGGSAKHDVPPETYNTTPENYQAQLSYYLFGLLGEDQESSMEMLTVACHNKTAGTLHFLEVPVDAYLGEEGTWAVKRVGNVWNNPKPLQWCDVCRTELKEEEIVDGRHRACEAVVTEKAGSAYRDLIKVINTQYGLPVDHFFIMPQQAFIQLVDSVGGVDVELSAYMTVGEVEYPTGVQTLDGRAALQYITDTPTSVEGDLSRIISCRQVYAALLQRLFKLEEQELFNTNPASPEEGVMGGVMQSANPVRTLATNKEITDIWNSLKKIPFKSMVMYRMPGEVATQNGETLFSVHKEELLTLLRKEFDPFGREIYGKEIQASDLNITEIATTESGDTRKQTMADVVEEQKGIVTTTTTTTTAAVGEEPAA